MKVIKIFAVAFLSIFGVYLLYFNLVMALNTDGHLISPFTFFILDGDKWSSDYYFGFSSIIAIFENFPRGLRIDGVFELTTEFFNTLDGDNGLFNSLNNLVEGDGDVFDLLFSLVKLFFAPLYALISFLALQLGMLATIVDLLIWAFQVLNGNYNIPMSNWSSPYSSTSVSVMDFDWQIIDGSLVW